MHPAPVYIGSFSAVRWAKGGEEYISDAVSIFNEVNWGWAYFSATGWHGWNPDYDNIFSNDESYKWKEHRVGQDSARWETLRKIFLPKDGASKEGS